MGGGFRAGQSGGGWTVHEQTMRPSEGVVSGKKGLKRKRVEQWGERETFIPLAVAYHPRSIVAF
jgi:hypothetical protein